MRAYVLLVILTAVPALAEVAPGPTASPTPSPDTSQSATPGAPAAAKPAAAPTAPAEIQGGGAAGPDAGQTTAALWADKCAGCHGATGNGKTKYGKKHKIPSFATAKWQSKITDDEILNTITNGVYEHGNKLMPPFKEKLSATQIAELGKYVRTLAN